MSNYPHPADYMSDAQYEQFVRDGGISDLSVDVDVLNYGYSPTEELLVENFSGFYEDLSERAKEVVSESDVEDLDAGHWLTIVDGELKEAGEFLPYRTHVRVH